MWILVVCLQWDEVKDGHIEKSQVSQLQGRDDRQCHEAEGHDGFQVLADAQLCQGGVVELSQLVVDPFARLVAHNASYGQGEAGQDGFILDQDDAALLLDQLFDGKGHIGVTGAGGDNIV